MYDITLLAYDYIEFLYNSNTNYYCAPNQDYSDEASPIFKMEIWMQEPLPFFKEKKFLKTVSHLEHTGQKKL